MADNTPNSLDAQAAAPPPAATPEPTPAAPPAAPTPSGGLWASLTGKQKLLVVAGGSVVAAVGAMYGAKQFSPTPGRAVAQSPPPIIAPEPTPKAEPESKPAANKDDDILVHPVVAAPIRPVNDQDGGPVIKPVTAPKLGADGKPILEAGAGGKDDKAVDLDIAAPPIPSPPARGPETRPEAQPGAPAPLPTDLNIPEPKPTGDPTKKPVPEYRIPLPPGPEGDRPAKPAVPDLALPDVPPAPGGRKPATDDPITLPAPVPVAKIPAPGAKPAPTPGDDQFKAAGQSGDDLPTINVNKKVKPAGPVIPAGGTDTNPPTPEKKPGDPAGLKLEFDAPPVPPAKKPGETDIPKVDLDLPPPPAPTPRKDVALPPPPGIDDKVPAPPLPTTPVLPEVKTPTVKVPDAAPPVAAPTIEVGPAPVKPKIEVGPAPLPPVGGGAPAEPAKKDSYEEDWHTPDGTVNTYVGISNFYYKTPDYAKALEAYNRDRRKPGESIVRVPPTWVLEEKFPALMGKDAKPAGPTPAGLTFDKVEPASGSRPAPTPAPAGGTGSSNEYRVTEEAGEKIKDIARKLYGDPNAWRKLTDLNPNLDPTEPIPAGTTLRVGSK